MLLKALAITLTFCIFHNCTYCHLKIEEIWSLLSNEKQDIFFWFCNSVKSATCSPCSTVTQGSHFLVSEQESAHNVYLASSTLTSLSFQPWKPILKNIFSIHPLNQIYWLPITWLPTQSAAHIKILKDLKYYEGFTD